MGLRRKDIVHAIALLITVIFIVSVIVGLSNYDSLEGEVTERIEKYGFFGVFVLSLLVELIPQYLAPQAAIFSAALFDFNPIIVMTLAILGSITGSVLGYELGRKYGFHVVNDFVTPEQKKWVWNALNKKGRWVISLAALTPLPYIPLVLGAFHMSRSNFWGYGVLIRIIGLILGTFLFYGIV